jgi:hypothetical protein
MSMIAKNMRNRRSKRYERQDGDLILVRKADQAGGGTTHQERTHFGGFSVSWWFVRTDSCGRE